MKKTITKNPPSFSHRLWVSIFLLLALLLIGSIIAVLYGSDFTKATANTALVRVDGVITGDADSSLLASSSVVSSTEIVRELEQARDDDNIKAVLLEINSPGVVLLLVMRLVRR